MCVCVCVCVCLCVCVCVCVCYLVYPKGDVSEAALLGGILHQLPVHGPELVKLICENTNTHRSANLKTVPMIRHVDLINYPSSKRVM